MVEQLVKVAYVKRYSKTISFMFMPDCCKWLQAAVDRIVQRFKHHRAIEYTAWTSSELAHSEPQAEEIISVNSRVV